MAPAGQLLASSPASGHRAVRVGSLISMQVREITRGGVMKKLLVFLAVVALFATPSQFAFAASDVGFKSLGVDLGYVSPENVDGTLGFGGFADLGALSPKVRLSTHLGYWGKSQDAGFGSASFHDISLTGRVRYMFPVWSRKFQPYAGGGVGLPCL